MALLEEDLQDDLMPIIGDAYDTFLELDEEDDLMPRLDAQPCNCPDTKEVRKGVIFGPESEFVGEFGDVQFTTEPQKTEDP